LVTDDSRPHIVWDTDAFAGYGWVTEEAVVILHLDRKDQPGITFIEAIIIGANGNNRGRTWHCFRGSVLFQRTLCNEGQLKLLAEQLPGGDLDDGFAGIFPPH